MQQKIWLITGISSGLGKALAEAVLNEGDFVIGTFRQQTQADVFNNLHQSEAFALKMDITKPDDIKKGFETLAARFGRLDVLVNNAGFGFAGAIEEASMEEVRHVFEANFFGALRVTQAALPIFRAQRAGHIIQISSQAGIKATPGFGIYNASKFALEGFSEALAAEILPLGIRLSIVEPGPFRTNFASSSWHEAALHIPDYQGTAGIFRERMQQIKGRQEGDPDKAARAIIQISRLETPPLRLPLGKMAVANISAKLDSVKTDLDAWREVAEEAVYPT